MSKEACSECPVMERMCDDDYWDDDPCGNCAEHEREENPECRSCEEKDCASCYLTIEAAERAVGA